MTYEYAFWYAIGAFIAAVWFSDDYGFDEKAVLVAIGICWPFMAFLLTLGKCLAWAKKLVKS